MFDFFNDLFDEFKKSSYRIQIDSGKKIVVEGYKNILLIDSKNIVLKLCEEELSITGNDLKIQQFGTNTIIVCGKITQISTQGGKNEK